MGNKIFKFIFVIVLFCMTCAPGAFAEEKKPKAPEKKEVKITDKELSALKEENNQLKEERGMLYEDLGTAYTKAGLFDEAIDAYTKSLSYSPNNARIHYYLGLLYQKSLRDPQKAVFHLKKYLYIDRDAKDKDEVKYMIEMLLNKR